MANPKLTLLAALAWVLIVATQATAQQTHPSGHAGHEVTLQPATRSVEPDPGQPLLPEGRTLDEVLDYAAEPRPTSFGAPIHDDAIFTFPVHAFDFVISMRPVTFSLFGALLVAVSPS